MLVKELRDRARRAAGDLLEGVGRVVVLAGEDRPFARDEQFSLTCRYPGTDQAVEDLTLGLDPEADGLADFGGKPRLSDPPPDLVPGAVLGPVFGNVLRVV